jgi:hypothetical protein
VTKIKDYLRDLAIMCGGVCSLGLIYAQDRPMATPPSTVIHQVKPQETLSEILYRRIGDLGLIDKVRIYGKNGLLNQTIALNPELADPDLIYPGIKIRLPAIGPYAASEVTFQAPLPAPTPLPEPSAAPAPEPSPVAVVTSVVPVMAEEPKTVTVVEEIEKETTPGKWFLQPGLGFTTSNYLSAERINYSSEALTVKGAVSYRLSPQWEVGGNVFYTAFFLSKSDPATDVRYLGLNARVGYTVPWLTDPWSLSLCAGMYQLSMSVTNDQFGFSGLTGPQLFPVIRRKLSEFDSLSGYLKLSTVSSGSLNVTDLTNREIAAGIHYSRALGKSGTRLGLTVDYSDLSVGLFGFPMTLKTLTLGTALSFSP